MSSLDDIERRAKALGWTALRDGDWLRLNKEAGPDSMRFITYLEQDGRLELFGHSPFCSHERELLERDGEVIDTLRSLVAQVEDFEARLAEMKRGVTRLVATMAVES